MRVEVLLECADDVGESPVWDDRERCLRWVDLLAGTVRSITPAGALTEVRAGCAVGAIGLTDTDALVAAVRNGFAALSPADGRLSMLAEVEADAPDRRMNDGKCDPWGGFVAGTMRDDQGTATGTLHRLGPDGAVTAGESGFTCPNGLDWAPDGRIYHADTPTGRIDVCDLDPDTHLPVTRRPFVHVDGPDGLTLDTDGGLWVALWGGGRVHRYTPDGRLDRVVALPVSQPASCAFGGQDRRTLFVTTARHGLSDAELAAQPLAGALFAVDDLAQGLPAHRFGLSRLAGRPTWNG
ncbi:MAG TPA: SMP-30/gluconolactonase/LRE family protein [Pseudonocardia sp.]|nr:SMP-30/gluconolactonase/LRE family protein [Pseudonocardia sp.]